MRAAVRGRGALRGAAPPAVGAAHLHPRRGADEIQDRLRVRPDRRLRAGGHGLSDASAPGPRIRPDAPGAGRIHHGHGRVLLHALRQRHRHLQRDRAPLQDHGLCLPVPGPVRGDGAGAVPGAAGFRGPAPGHAGHAARPAVRAEPPGRLPVGARQRREQAGGAGRPAAGQAARRDPARAGRRRVPRRAGRGRAQRRGPRPALPPSAAVRRAPLRASHRQEGQSRGARGHLPDPGAGHHRHGARRAAHRVRGPPEREPAGPAAQRRPGARGGLPAAWHPACRAAHAQSVRRPAFRARWPGPRARGLFGGSGGRHAGPGGSLAPGVRRPATPCCAG